MEVSVLGNEQIKEQDLPEHMYKSLKPSLKWNRHLNPEVLKQGIIDIEKIYYPMWTVRMLVIADRKPFSPKVKPNLAFIDGISGYRGLLSSVPPLVSKAVSNSSIKQPTITKEELNKYIYDVQDKQINRSYVLKKPRYEIKEINQTHLPLWKVEVSTDYLTKTFLINGNTGEPEELIQKLSTSDEWTL
ncbi:hypothetical protein GLW08_15095 [Pontibacillus yanchengensis]|uniref:Uncharacterized protein n=2 Tax=Pontibacillus yanchengensis TaxID=462910 RepID=A0ACC7VJ66_9BACI|nr:hypothetical protein [Pontibacillus yanchengensis]MYL35813.1 hypothetical protein [Pontibacillus yanchengensis]MYL54660.1 hypothetical protein [Pontibacillus yanchengensis]